MLITKEFMFEAAHFLPEYDGPCANMHGHSYRLQITIAGKIGKNGMVKDFSELKRIVSEHVISKLDHQLLNEAIGKYPTAENISVWIWERLKKHLSLFEIKLWETATSYVTYHGNEIK